jgi:hypothetical protein
MIASMRQQMQKKSNHFSCKHHTVAGDRKQEPVKRQVMLLRMIQAIPHRQNNLKQRAGNKNKKNLIYAEY